eukprot:scaffold243901_cov31-Tisochrysis_lutea.AAC.5
MVSNQTDRPSERASPWDGTGYERPGGHVKPQSHLTTSRHTCREPVVALPLRRVGGGAATGGKRGRERPERKGTGIRASGRHPGLILPCARPSARRLACTATQLLPSPCCSLHSGG